MRNHETKPLYLYHGSPKLISVLEPRPARGVGIAKHKLTGIYASPSRTFATAFALPIVPNKQGQLAWQLEFGGPHPRIKIKAGRLDEDGVGYVYQLPAQGFEELDEHQWITYEPIEPLHYEEIQANDYVGWIVYEDNRK